MSKQTRTHLKSRFSAGSIPKETDFADLFDSSYSLVDDNIILDVDGVKAIDVNLIPNLSADKTTSGQFSSDRIPELDAAKIASGVLLDAIIPSLAADKTTSGSFHADRVPGLDTSKIETGEFDLNRIPSLDAAKITTGVFTSSQVPDLAADKITTGKFATDLIPSLTTEIITSGQFDSGLIPDLDASKITSGLLLAATIPNIDAEKVASGTLVADRIPSLDASKITSGILADGQIPELSAAKITSAQFSSDRIPNLDAAKIASGVLLDTIIPNLSADKTTSGSFHTDRVPALDTSKIESGEFDTNRIPSLDAGKITTGQFADSLIPNINASKTNSGQFETARIPNLAASKVTSGQLATARIPSLSANKITSGVLGSARLPSASIDATGIVQFASAQQLLNADDGVVVSPKNMQDSITTAAVATDERLALLEASVDFLTDVDFILDTQVEVNSNNPAIIDGYSVAQDDRILLINQSDTRNNRVWAVSASGNWVVANDFDETIVGSPSIALSIGTSLKVLFGDMYGNTIWSIATINAIPDSLSELDWRRRSDVVYGIDGVVVTAINSGNHAISVDTNWMGSFVQTYVESQTTPIGSIIDWWSPEASPTIPTGWVETDGRTVTSGDTGYDPQFYNMTLPTITSATSGSLKLIRVL